MNNWSFASIWNASLDKDRPREYKPRDYCYASELGRGLYDRYWKMKGRIPTTPPNARALRKFEAGNLAEYIMQQVLARAGVLRATQKPLEDVSGSIGVHGRFDFEAGGKITALSSDELLGLPESFVEIASGAISTLKEKHPKGLREQGIEIKSCSAVMFEKYSVAPGYHHALQAYFYARMTDKPYLLVYVSRDDLRLQEWLILPDSTKWREEYEADLKKMSVFITLTEKEVEQYKEPLLIWDEENKKFTKNWNVEYSSYLTDYGFERSDLYAEASAKAVSALNYVAKRIMEGKELTKRNKETHLVIGYKFYPEAEKIMEGLKDVSKNN